MSATVANLNIHAGTVGAPVVGAWLRLIIVNLLTMWMYFDVALRDLGLTLAGFSLWRLSLEYAGERRMR